MMISYDSDDIERIGLLRRKPVLQSMVKSDAEVKDHLLYKEEDGTRCRCINCRYSRKIA